MSEPTGREPDDEEWEYQMEAARVRAWDEAFTTNEPEA